MDMINLLALIKQHTELFADSVARRMETSTGNKKAHAQMLYFLDNKDWEGVSYLLEEPY